MVAASFVHPGERRGRPARDRYCPHREDPNRRLFTAGGGALPGQIGRVRGACRAVGADLPGGTRRLVGNDPRGAGRRGPRSPLHRAPERL